jgi:DNA polymerase III subunit beta
MPSPRRARRDHDFLTLPWTDNGWRVLPAATYFEHTQKMQEHKTTVLAAVGKFIARYEDVVRNQSRLGTLRKVSLRTVCTAQVTRPGSCTLPARKLYEYVRLLGEGEITIKSLPNDWVQIRSGRSHTKMVGLPRKNFPSLPLFPAGSAITLPKDALRTMIVRTIFAISQEESRYTLNGALLILQPDSMAMVATDGHRLAYIKTARNTVGVNSEIRVLIPRKALAEIYSLLNSNGADIFQLARDDSNLFFRVGTRLLTSRQLAGVFPNYEAVMPRDMPHKLSLTAAEFSMAVQRVSQFSDTSNAVRLTTDKNELRLSSSNAEMGESEEVLATSYGGDPVKMGFHSGYLLDFVKVAGAERVTFHFKEPSGAAEFRPDQSSTSDYQYRYVVMPMRA